MNSWLSRTPFFIRKPLKEIVYGISDSVEVLTGRRSPLIPPQRLIRVGPGDFTAIGQAFFGYFKNVGNLKPSDNVLDIGCGVGRMAMPLTLYLNPDARYEGFDLFADGIKWCRKKISSRYPNFRFQRLDIYSQHYNPKGKWKPSEYRFPFPDRSFEFVFLTSVFTHMLPEDMNHYLSEIHRLLNKGGRCFSTYFLLNDESKRLMKENKSTEYFQSIGECSVLDPDDPEAVVAYEDVYIKSCHEKHGLKIVEPIHYGKWCGRSRYLNYQDIIVAIKEDS